MKLINYFSLTFLIALKKKDLALIFLLLMNLNENVIKNIVFDLIIYSCGFYLLTVVILYCFSYYSTFRFNKKIDCIVVLGCRLSNNNQITSELKKRLDKCIEAFHLMNDKTIILSGGPAHNNVSEADAMKEYLLANSIHPSSIVVENKSKNTFENIQNINKLIDLKNKSVLLITSDYHALRSYVIFKSVEKAVKVYCYTSKTRKKDARLILSEIDKIINIHIKLIINLI